MKKVLMIVFGLVLISSCELRPLPKEDTNRMDSGIELVGRYDFKQNGMNYSIYREIDGGLVVVNWTKDSLEAEVAKKELQSK